MAIPGQAPSSSRSPEAQAHADLVEAVYTAYNNRKLDDAATLVTEDYEFLMTPTGQVFHGPDGIRQYLSSWAEGYPDSTVEVVNIIAGDNQVVVQYRGSGTHEGTLRTPAGDIPATGKHAELQFCDVYQITDGKINSGRTYFDLLTMLRQLGLAD